MGQTAEVGRDFSIIGLILHADIVVQAVMLGLVIASVVCWALIFEKYWRLSRLGREVRELESSSVEGALPAPRRATGLNAGITSATEAEWQASPHGQSAGELRDRLERAMRVASKIQLKKLETGLPFLATLGSAAPFIGLFGTVWGIMNSFTSIAQSKDTSLSVVAPGIAEALFATAIGLAAAIPAVIAYNQIAVSLGRYSDRIGTAVSVIARNLAQRGNSSGAR